MNRLPDAVLDYCIGDKIVKPTFSRIEYDKRKGVCQNDASSFFTNKAPTFTSQGFVMSKRFCTFRH